MLNILWPDIVSVFQNASTLDISQMIGFLFSAYDFFIFLYKNYRTIVHFSWEMDINVASNILNLLKEKSRECQNHKLQPTPDTKRKRKRAKLTRSKKKERKTNTREAHRRVLPSPSEVITMLKGLEKNTRTNSKAILNMKRPVANMK